MAEIERFEEKLRLIMSRVMKHAVAGHTTKGLNTFCNDSGHALEILRTEGVTPMDTAIVERYLDSGIS